MRHLSFIMPLLAAFAIALTGCSGSGTAPALLCAEAVMEENPDSAFSILEAIRTDSLRPALSRADSAKFALLYTQAQIKRKVPVADDSLISVAVKHYSARKDSPDLMKSLFYKARVEYNRGDMTAAIVPAMRARELAIGFDDSYWRAKAAELISDIYSIIYFEKESIDYTEEAAEHYKKAGKTRNHLFALCDLATVRSNFGVDDNRNIALLDSVRKIAIKEPADSLLVAYADRVLFMMYVDLRDVQKSKNTLQELSSLADYYHPGSKEYAYIARMELIGNDHTAAMRHAATADSMAGNSAEKASVFDVYAKLYSSMNLDRKAKEYTDSLLQSQNEEIQRITKQSAIAIQRDHYQREADTQTQKAERSRLFAIASCIILLTVICGVTLFYHEKMRRKKAEIDSRMKDILILSKEISEKQKDNQTLSSSLTTKENEILRLNETLLSQKNDLEEKETAISSLTERLNDNTAHDRLREEMEGLFKGQWKTLNMLCNEYFEADGSISDKSRIHKNIETEIRKLRSPKNLKQIEDATNEYIDGIITRLREQCSFIKESDITFLNLILAGFAPRSVCFFTDISLKNFYAKRARLRKRICESDAPDKDCFLLRL